MLNFTVFFSFRHENRSHMLNKFMTNDSKSTVPVSKMGCSLNLVTWQLNSRIFTNHNLWWDVILCSLLNVSRHFKITATSSGELKFVAVFGICFTHTHTHTHIGFNCQKSLCHLFSNAHLMHKITRALNIQEWVSDTQDHTCFKCVLKTCIICRKEILLDKVII